MYNAGIMQAYCRYNAGIMESRRKKHDRLAVFENKLGNT
jgi:hypothetical protein